MAKPSSSSQNRRRPHSLSHGRRTIPLSTSSSSPRHIASRHTRRLIRSHHTLNKQLANAVRANNTSLATTLRAQLEAQGGLEVYQAASATGADKNRGGDTSRKLLGFLAPFSRSGELEIDAGAKRKRKRKMLDVGAVSCDTAVSRSGIFDEIERIDLRSREKGVTEQDFMQRALPVSEAERFDLVCLSLVLNYVPDAKGRGEMLKRVCEFMAIQDPARGMDEQGTTQDLFPALFLVLPAPCVMNSRYLSKELLEAIMAALGFSLVEEKLTAKLAYFLWRWHGRRDGDKRGKFPKREVNPGKSRNNFAIVLD